ncbi:MAG: hypothetical protein IPK52_11060 [Chloroflexi bacterium]|nr:hypothetical protein [Chloroflexota bacterium]
MTKRFSTGDGGELELLALSQDLWLTAIVIISRCGDGSRPAGHVVVRVQIGLARPHHLVFVTACAAARFPLIAVLCPRRR